MPPAARPERRVVTMTSRSRSDAVRQLLGPVGDETVALVAGPQQPLHRPTEPERGVRLVDEDPVRKAPRGALGVDDAGEVVQVCRGLGLRGEREVEDDGQGPLAQQAEQLVRPRRRMTLEDDDVDEVLEPVVVALDVDDEDRVAGADPLLGEQAGEVGLARSAVAADEDVGSGGGDAHRGAVGVGPDDDVVPARADEMTTGEQGSAQEPGHPLAVGLVEHEIGVLLHRRHRVGDGDADLGGVEEGEVVLGIPDGENVVRREAELVKGGQQPGALGHPGRQDHEPLAVAEQLGVDAQLGDDVEQAGGVLGAALEDRVTAPDVDPLAPRALLQGVVDLRGEEGELLRGLQDGAVLRDDGVECRPEAGKWASSSSVIRPVTRIVARPAARTSCSASRVRGATGPPR